MSVPLPLITALVVAALLPCCTNCDYLAWHPVVTSATGQKLCARHRIPLITVHGYGHRGEDVILYHWAGMNHTVDACNPNRIDPDCSLHPTKRNSHRWTFSYCSECERAWQKHWNSPGRERDATFWEKLTTNTFMR